MLSINVQSKEIWDEVNEIIIDIKPLTLHLEHSLLSVSKWEQKIKKPFLYQDDMTRQELVYYIKCMTLDKNIDDVYYMALTPSDFENVKAYINDTMTATTIKKSQGKRNNTILTNEVIYGYMTNLGIPFSCEKWHLNRLLTLIQVCSELNKAPSKMNKNDALERRRALNAQRRAKIHSKG